MPRRRLFVEMSALVVTASLAACGGASPPPAAPAPSAAPSVALGPAQATIEMTDGFDFDPPQVTIRAGQAVLWHNTSHYTHRVTDDSAKAVAPRDVALPAGAEPFDSGPIAPGKSFEVTLKTPGTYKYFCLMHEAIGMIGEITVTP